MLCGFVKKLMCAMCDEVNELSDSIVHCVLLVHRLDDHHCRNSAAALSSGCSVFH